MLRGCPPAGSATTMGAEAESDFDWQNWGREAELREVMQPEQSRGPMLCGCGGD